MRMPFFSTVVNVLGILIMLAALFGFSLFTSLRHKRSRLLCMMMLCFTGVLLADMASSVWNGRREYENYLYAAAELKMMMNVLLMVFYISFFREEMGLKGKKWRRFTVASHFVLTALAVLVALNPLHHRLIRISPTGRATVQPLFRVATGLYCAVYLLSLLVAMRRTEVRMQSRVAIVFFSLAHLIGIFMRPRYGEFVPTSFATQVALMVLYISFYGEQNRKFSQQELELQNARTALVVSQIQPHFLFNSMATVMDLCDTDPREARQALQELSDYLHCKLNSISGNYLVNFSEDVDFLQNYLRLEKRRYGERLRVEYDIEAENFHIPLLTLQPLVENAICHGIRKRPGGGTIRISSREEKRGFAVAVSDDGVGFDPSATPLSGGEHVGLNNVRSRLEALCDGKLDIKSHVGEGTSVEIFIPKK